jgi:hypothetical protein
MELILAAGIGLNRLGSQLRERRMAQRHIVSEMA